MGVVRRYSEVNLSPGDDLVKNSLLRFPFLHRSHPYAFSENPPKSCICSLAGVRAAVLCTVACVIQIFAWRAAARRHFVKVLQGWIQHTFRLTTDLTSAPP